MVEWLLENRDWLFNGAGVAVVLGTFGVVRAGFKRWRRLGSATESNVSREQLMKPPFQSRLPAFVLRAVYKPETVQSRVKVDLRPHAPGHVTLGGGGRVPSVDLYFQVTNLSPIHLTLDRLLVDVWFGQPTFTCLALHRYAIPAGEITQEIHVRQTLSENQKAQIEEFNAAPQIHGRLHVYITAYFESKLGWFFVQNAIERDGL